MGYKDMTDEGKPKQKWMKKVQPRAGSSVQTVVPEEHAEAPVSSYQGSAGKNLSTDEFQRRQAAIDAAKNKKSIAQAPVIVEGSDVAPYVSEQLQAELVQAIADDLELSKPLVIKNEIASDEAVVVIQEAMDRLEENRALLLKSRAALETEVAANNKLRGRVSECEHLVQSLQDDTERLAEEKKVVEELLKGTLVADSIIKTKKGKTRIRLLCNVADGERIIDLPLAQLKDKLSGGKS